MKRFMSIFLAAIMVLSFIPAAGAVTYPEGAEVPQTYEYVFTNAAHSTGTGGYSLIVNKPEAKDTIETVSPNKWGYGGTISGGDFYSANLALYSGHLNWSFVLKNTEAPISLFNPDKNENFPVFLLEIEVPKAGTFVPFLEYHKINSSSVIELFIVKKKADEAFQIGVNALNYARKISPADRLGVVDMHTTGDEITGCETAFSARTLDAGSYYLVFVAREFNGTPEDSNISRQKFQSFRLEPVADDAVAKYVFGAGVVDATSAKAVDGIKNGDVNTQKSDNYFFGGHYANKNRLALESDSNEKNQRMRFNYSVSSNNPSKTAYTVLSLEIPHPGKYSVSIEGRKSPKDGENNIFGADGAFYMMIPTTESFDKAKLCTEETKLGEYKFYNNTQSSSRNIEILHKNFNAESAGIYWFVIEIGNQNGAAATSATHYEAGIYSISLTNLGLTDAQIKAAAAREVNPENAASNDVTLGNESAEIKVLTSTVAADEGTLVGELCSNAAVGSAQSITAPVIENREFLYWTSGIGTDRKIVCETEKYDFTAQKGVTYLTAVYRDMTSDYVSVIFLNGNGELISRSDARYKEGDTIDIEELPTLTGFGAASGWQLAGTENVYTTENMVTATRKVMVFVAQYANEETSINITVNGGTMKVEDGKIDPAYGDKVTVTAPSREGGSGYNVFAYWTKTVNGREAAIVSLDKEYSFNAWEDCTLTAVYTEQQIEPLAASVRKILLGTMNNNINIAEFIGCDGAIERGILYGEGTPTVDNWSNKISMTTANNALSVINNSGKTARAYAIFNDGVIYSK